MILKLSKITGVKMAVIVCSVFVSTAAYGQQGKTNSGLLAKTFEAHGGLEQWRKQKTLTYTLKDFPLSPQVAKPNTSTVDLSNRFNRIVGEGFTVGFDGNEAWSVPGPDAVGLPPRLFSLGSFYFVGMPFVFADPGTILQDKGTASFQGKEYKVVSVSYDRGVGYTSKDDYVLYIDQTTHLLKLIHHSVTEPTYQVKRVTWVFDAWQDISELKVPLRMTYYKGWNDGNLKGDGASCTVENAAFSPKPVNPSIYSRPAEGIVDDSPIQG